MAFNTRRSDVVVVGAGPAGAWTAFRLAAAGARVTVFDPSHPREKPCGGGITGRALSLVAHALTGVPLPGIAVTAVRFEQDRAAPVTIPLPGDALRIASRTAFDGALLAAAVRAGATLVEERVRDVRVASGGARVWTAGGAWQAGWIVGADGANSLVRRRLSVPFARDRLSIATGYFVPGRSSSEIVVRFVCDPPGYLWSFPRPDHLAVGICAQAHEARTGPLRCVTADWLQLNGLDDGAPLVPYAWPIPSLGPKDLTADRPSGAGWLLAGDAAGLVDPITREGIFFALQSADLAAAALLDGGRPADRYAAALADEIYPELRLAARLKAGFFRPRFTRLMLTGLARSRRLRTVMTDLIAGRQPYRTLRRRLIGTIEPGLAWNLFIGSR